MKSSDTITRWPYQWREDPEGDLHLEVGPEREYAGLVCPHREGHSTVLVVIDGKLITNCPTVEEAKVALIAQVEEDVAVRQFRERYRQKHKRGSHR